MKDQTIFCPACGERCQKATKELDSVVQPARECPNGHSWRMQHQIDHKGRRLLSLQSFASYPLPSDGSPLTPEELRQKLRELEPGATFLVGTAEERVTVSQWAPVLSARGEMKVPAIKTRRVPEGFLVAAASGKK